MVFRRRPLRPRPGIGVRRPLAARRVPPVVRQAMARAARAIHEGDYARAAQIYARLADGAYARDMLRAGAQMDMESARAWLRGGNYAEASQRCLGALEALLRLGRMPRVALSLLDRITEAMVDSGAADGAEALRQKADELLAAHGMSRKGIAQAVQTEQPKRGRLPAHCPSCHAPLRPDEVEWLAPDRAQCPYCGSVVLTS